MSIEHESKHFSSNPIEILKEENPILEFTEDQVNQIEEHFQAEFAYEKGLNGSVCVSSSDEFNPVRISNFPTREEEKDILLENMAIAKVGLILEYWKLYGEALKSGKMNFYQQISYSFTPILNESGEIIPALFSNRDFFGKPTLEYPERNKYEYLIMKINYAGDGDFVGRTSGPIPMSIKVKVGDEIKQFPRTRLDIPESLTREVTQVFEDIRRTSEREIGKLIWEGRGNFDTPTQHLIEDTLKESETLGAYGLAKTWIKGWGKYFNLIEIQKNVGDYVNSMYTMDPESFKTLSEVERMVELMEIMYQNASRHYKR